jgi:hypothetical protein
MDFAVITQQVNSDRIAMQNELEVFLSKWRKQRQERHKWFAKRLSLNATSDMSSPEFFAALDVLTEISGNLEDSLWMSGFDGNTGEDWLNKVEAPPMNRRRDVLRVILHGVMEKYVGDRLDLDIANFLQVVQESPEEVVTTIVSHGSAAPSQPNHPSLETKLSDIEEISELPTMTWNALRQGGFYYFGDLLVHSEDEMSHVDRLGGKGLFLLKQVLSNLGCYHGMRDISEEQQRLYRDGRSVRRWFLNRGRLSIKTLVESELDDHDDFVFECEKREIYVFRDFMTAPTSTIGAILVDNDKWVTVVNDLVRSQEVPGFKLGMSWIQEVERD